MLLLNIILTEMSYIFVYYIKTGISAKLTESQKYDLTEQLTCWPSVTIFLKSQMRFSSTFGLVLIISRETDIN